MSLALQGCIVPVDRAIMGPIPRGPTWATDENGYLYSKLLWIKASAKLVNWIGVNALEDGLWL